MGIWARCPPHSADAEFRGRGRLAATASTTPRHLRRLSLPDLSALADLHMADFGGPRALPNASQNHTVAPNHNGRSMKKKRGHRLHGHRRYVNWDRDFRRMRESAESRNFALHFTEVAPAAFLDERCRPQHERRNNLKGVTIGTTQRALTSRSTRNRTLSDGAATTSLPNGQCI